FGRGRREKSYGNEHERKPEIAGPNGNGSHGILGTPQASFRIWVSRCKPQEEQTESLHVQPDRRKVSKDQGYEIPYLDHEHGKSWLRLAIAYSVLDWLLSNVAMRENIDLSMRHLGRSFAEPKQLRLLRSNGDCFGPATAGEQSALRPVTPHE